jgi:2'-5' RNA ligase
MPSLRLFIAFSPPPRLKTELGHTIDELRSSDADVRWEAPDKLHATITFLGDSDESLLPAITDIIGRCGRSTPTCDVTYTGLGAFPTMQRPRVVWAGCEEKTGTLLSLKKRLEGGLLPLGFRTEERVFHPHITLGRLKGDRNIRNLISMLEKCMFEPRTVELGEVQLMKSVLNPGGSVYSVVYSTQLQPV